MASLANSIQSVAQSNQNQPATIAGTVLAAPAGFGDQILVVTDFAPLSPIGPMNFVASQGNTLPAAGDSCTVVYDNDHRPYCIWFDGAYSTPTVTGSAWVAPTLTNSWAHDPGFETVGYLKDPLGFVHIKGTIITGTTSTVAFVLPAGFRPGGLTFHAAAGGGPTAAAVEISTAGNVTCFYSGSSIGLSGITFLAEN